jgi:hypothetical protein
VPDGAYSTLIDPAAAPLESAGTGRRDMVNAPETS